MKFKKSKGIMRDTPMSLLIIFAVSILTLCLFTLWLKSNEKDKETTTDYVSITNAENTTETTVSNETTTESSEIQDDNTDESVTISLYEEQDMLPETIISLSDIFSELPDFNTPYLEARLPEKVKSILLNNNECNLIVSDQQTITFSTIALSRIVIRYYDIIMYDPILYYNNGNFYIVGTNTKNGTLYYMSSCAVGFGNLYFNFPKEYNIDVNTMNLENPKILNYFYEIEQTLVQLDNNTYSFFHCGKETYTFNLDAELENIQFNVPFLDNNNQLVMIEVYPDIINPHAKFEIIDSNVKYVYDSEFLHHSMSCYLYEKDDNTVHIAYFAMISGNFKEIVDIEDPNESIKFTICIDEFNRCFLVPDITFSDEDYLYLVNAIYICDITVYDDRLDDLINVPFSYSEKDKMVEELLTYINN